MARDRKETELKLISATGQVLAKQGFAKLGVNAIAREARLDKVLIYRYFEGLPGLMRAYAKQGDFWPNVDELLGEPEESFVLKSPALQLTQVMTNHAMALRKRPITLQILSWEMVERNELTSYLEDVREKQGVALTERLVALQEQKPTVDIGALAALLTGALNYLTARSEHIKWFNGVNLQNDEGWQRLLHTVASIADALLGD